MFFLMTAAKVRIRFLHFLGLYLNMASKRRNCDGHDTFDPKSKIQKVVSGRRSKEYTADDAFYMVSRITIVVTLWCVL